MYNLEGPPGLLTHIFFPPCLLNSFLSLSYCITVVLSIHVSLLCFLLLWALCAPPQEQVRLFLFGLLLLLLIPSTPITT